MNMPPWLHIALIVIFTIYFIVKFIKDRYLYEFIFIIWAPSTLLTYVVTDKTWLLILGILQVIVFIVVFALMFKRREHTISLTHKMLAEFNTSQYEPNEIDSNESTPIENDNDSNSKEPK